MRPRLARKAYLRGCHAIVLPHGGGQVTVVGKTCVASNVAKRKVTANNQLASVMQAHTQHVLMGGEAESRSKGPREVTYR